MNWDFAHQKFTLLDQKSDRYFMILVCLVFGVLFINVFVPFNINRWYSDSGLIQFLRLSSYGFVVSLVLLFTQFPLRKLFNVKSFTLKTYSFWVVIEILLMSLVYIFLYGNPLGNFMNDFIFSIKYTLLGICVPYSFALLIIYYRKQQVKIRTMSDQMQTPIQNQLIAFKDEYGKVKFSLALEDILLLESTDNYVTVYFKAGEKTERQLLRNSLKKLEHTFSDYGIARCHRSFMINLAKIEMIRKQGKKLQLKLKNLERDIPVSEKYSPQIEAISSPELPFHP